MFDVDRPTEARDGRNKRHFDFVTLVICLSKWQPSSKTQIRSALGKCEHEWRLYFPHFSLHQVRELMNNFETLKGRLPTLQNKSGVYFFHRGLPFLFLICGMLQSCPMALWFEAISRKPELVRSNFPHARVRFVPVRLSQVSALVRCLPCVRARVSRRQPPFRLFCFVSLSSTLISPYMIQV